MGEQNRVLVGLRCLLAVQPLEVRMAERDVDRAHPVRPFGVAFRRDMLKKDRVFVKAGALC